MADLTVLSPGPLPLYPQSSTPFASTSTLSSSPINRRSVAAFTRGPRFASRSTYDLSTPPASPYSASTPQSASASSLALDSPPSRSRQRTISEQPPPPHSPQRPFPPRRASAGDSGAIYDQNNHHINGHSHKPNHQSDPVVQPDNTLSASFLSPPIDYHRAPRPPLRQRTHARKRSSSAPPAPIPLQTDQPEYPHDPSQIAYIDQFGVIWKQRPKHPVRSKNQYEPSSTFELRDGLRDLNPPPPPLLRPTTFWKRIPRSGVSGASYSPATHLVRRSTFIAAGLAYESPGHDLSALCVESRAGRNKVVVKPGEQLVINASR